MNPKPALLDGAEPLSYVAGSPIGVVAIHGFTGNPFSMRGVADAMIAAGFDVELPRLPGHGTTIGDMIDTAWADWAGEVERVRDRLTDRVDRVVLAGQSMGATLALSSALARPGVAGLVCINPATRLRDADMMAMLDELIDDGVTVAPGEGSDIADPDSYDIAYDGTPLVALRSMMYDGVGAVSDRFGELTMPLRLFTSHHDHVVEPADSEHLVAAYGGPVEHTWLERSYHVATRDHDRHDLTAAAVQFVEALVR